MDRLQVAIVALLTGWVLSQLTELLKSKWRVNKLKKAIELELEDIEKLLSERVDSAKKTSLNYGHNDNFIYSVAVPISTPVLDAFYSEVADKFTEAQRYNLRVFRDQLNSYKSNLEWLEKCKTLEATQNEIVFKLFET